MLPACTTVKGSVNHPNVCLEAYPIRDFSFAGKHPICVVSFTCTVEIVVLENHIHVPLQLYKVVSTFSTYRQRKEAFVLGQNCTTTCVTGLMHCVHWLCCRCSASSTEALRNVWPENWKLLWRGFSGHDKDEVLQSCQSGVIKKSGLSFRSL